MSRSKTILFMLILLVLTACRAKSPTLAPVTPSPSPVSPAATATPQPSISASPTAPPSQVEPTPTQESAKSIPGNLNPASLNPTPTSPPTQVPQATSSSVEPTPIASTTQVEPPAEGCLEKAAFYADVTVPDDTFFKQGEVFTKTWRFRNEGTCTWTPDYRVVFHSGEIMDAPLANPFPTTVLPGEQVDISIEMRAPTRGGSYQSNWEFEDPNGARFGTGSAASDLFWVRIAVRFLDQNDLPQPDPGNQPIPPPSSGCSAQQNTQVEAQVMELINQARLSNGLSPLIYNAALSAAALTQSTDMACNNFVSHTGSNGSNWADRIRAQGYEYATYPLENIYVGDPQFGGDAQGAFTWWMNSQVHRDNILNSVVTEAGVGYVYNPNSEYGGYFTVDFALPK